MTDELIQIAEESTRGSFFLAVGNLASTIIYAIGVFLIAGLLGPELYGVYTLCFAIPSIFLSLVNLGVNQGLTKFSSTLYARGQKGKLAKLVYHGIIFNSIVGLLFFLLCFIFSDSLAASVIARPEYGGYVRLASFVILFQALFNSANAVFVGFYKMEFNALNSVIAAVVKVVFSPLLIVVGLAVFGALTGLVVSYLAAAVFGIFVVYTKIYRLLDRRNVNGHFSESIKKLLKYGFPLYAATIVISFYSQFQNIILAIFTSDVEVGFFKAAQNFSTLIRVISVPVGLSVFPAFARLDGKSDRLKAFFSLSVKYTSLMLLPIVLLIVFFSREVVLLVYGSAYVSTPFYLILIVLEFLSVGLGSIILGSFFNGIGETKMAFKINLVSFATFLPIALLLTQPYGVYGLIISNLAASFVSTVYGAFMARTKFNAKPDWRITAKIYLASFASLAPLFILEIFPHSNVLLKVLLGVSVFVFLYLTLLPFLRILSWQELTDLERAIGKTKPLALITKLFFSYERILLGLLKRNLPPHEQTDI